MAVKRIIVRAGAAVGLVVVAVGVMVLALAPNGEPPDAPSCGDIVSTYIGEYYAAHGEAPDSVLVDGLRGETPACAEEYARAQRDEQEMRKGLAEAGMVITCEDVMGTFSMVYVNEYGYEPSESEMAEFRRTAPECGRWGK